MTCTTRCTNAISAWLFPILSAVAMIASPAGAQTVSDSTFLDTDWALTQFTAGNAGSSTAAQVLAGGNPGSYRNVTDVLTAAPPGLNTIVLSTSIFTPFTYSPGVSGPIASLNYTEDASCTAGCFGSGQSTGPSLQQGGNLYILSSSTVITGPTAPWINHSLSGLTAADFGLVNVTSGGSIFDNTQHPNFSAAGAPIQFGFFRANGTSVGGLGYTLSAGIDNWAITLTQGVPVASIVPTLSQWSVAMLALAIALIGFAWKRRMR